MSHNCVFPFKNLGIENIFQATFKWVIIIIWKCKNIKRKNEKCKLNERIIRKTKRIIL